MKKQQTELKKSIQLDKSELQENKQKSTSVEMSCENGIYIVKKEDEKEYQIVMANYKLTSQKFESVEQANEYVKNKPIELIIAIWGVLTELNKN